MGKILIINASPRASVSNSKQYAELFISYYKDKAAYCSITRDNYLNLISMMEDCSDVLLVFPLYADALPVTLLDFLKYWVHNPPLNKPIISVMVNCGFLEPSQNNVAVRMIQFFCKQNNYSIGSVLKLGSGEAILGTPFRFIAVNAIKRLARSVWTGKYRTIQATMPLPPKIFLWASTHYWIKYGKKFGVTRQEMEIMKIEDE